ncbi:MAG: type II toxin-antitoxin system Phd/YefM family antitoxin [Proteobacteria bacterium]|nr:type II toxin-antitoxin system Phd/YefM family antitoxin [Pseudomonadota bacterium]
MMKLTIRDARRSLSHLDRLLAVEGEVTITRRGEAIARLMPMNRKVAIPSHSDLREKMPRLRKGSEILIRKDRDAR